MKIRSKLFKAYLLKRGKVRNVLDLIGNEQIWSYLGGYDFASEFVKYAKDGYNDQLTRNHNLGSEDSILVLGAYKGATIQEWLNQYQVKVFAVEPIPEYVQTLRSRFNANPRVKIFPFAVGENSEQIELSVDEWNTSNFINSAKKYKCDKRDIATFIDTLAPPPRVMEVNIEGGEYEVMFRLIETGKIKDVDTLLIQFHNYGLRCEYDRAKIRWNLATTHECVFNYDWIWERWEKKQTNK